MWKTPNVAEETTWWLLGQIMVGQWKTFCISWLHMNVGSSFTDGNQDKETLCCASLVLAKSGRIPVTRVSLLISIYKDKRCSFRQQNRTAEIMWPNIRSHDFHTSSGERTWSQNMHVSGPFLHEKNFFSFSANASIEEAGADMDSSTLCVICSVHVIASHRIVLTVFKILLSEVT